MQRKKKNRGFTLVEILTALSIVGMISLAVMAVLGSGLHVYERIQVYGITQADVLLTLDQMERDLRNTFMFSGIDFTGDAEKVYFVGILKNMNAQEEIGTSLGKIGYRFDASIKKLILENEIYPSLTGNTMSSLSEAAVEALKFTYYYFDTETEKYDWKSSWGKQDEGIPSGVKVELTFKDGAKNVALERTILIPAG